jgi:CRISPR-associated protein Csm5
MTFLTRHTLKLTPLSPIHIGSGEDFTPTNYVIEKGWLYGFDPSAARLPDTLLKQLSTLGEQANLLGIQKFFIDHKNAFIPYAKVIMPVAKGVAAHYEKNIGHAANIESNGNRVFNQFTIERLVHSRQTPYIPGSSLKGALRTAMMDAINQGKPLEKGDEKGNGSALAKRLLQGDFASSPLRLLKIADLMPETGIEPARAVLYAVNRYKHPGTDIGKDPKGVTTRKECILQGQYRAFTSDIVIQDLQGKGFHDAKKSTAPAFQPDIHKIAQDCNAYHRKRLRSELKAMEENHLVDSQWGGEIIELLTGEFKNKLDSGEAMLIRFGQYGGAESKTLSEVASIKIMGKRGEQPTFQSHTKTFWFAAQSNNEQKAMLPFGWAIVEIDPEGDSPELKKWCDSRASSLPNIHGRREELNKLRAEAEENKAKLQKEEEEKRQAAIAEEKAEEERKLRLAAMSPARREIEDFIAYCQARFNLLKGGRDNAFVEPYSKAKALSDHALAGDGWTPEDKKDAALAIEQWLPQISKDDMKNVKKKLKLSALKGLA